MSDALQALLDLIFCYTLQFLGWPQFWEHRFISI